MEMKEFKMIGGYHPATCLLIQKMEDGKPGDIIQCNELSKVCGHDVRVHQHGYGYIQSAIRYLEKAGIVWRLQRGECYYKCLEPVERLEYGKSNIQSAHRRVKRGSRIVGSINLDDIPEERRNEHRAVMVTMGSLAILSRSASLKQIEKLDAPQSVDMPKMLEFMRGNGQKAG